MTIQVSVIIPTYKRDALLERCIKGLLSQDLAPQNFEIIIVDGATNPSTQELVKQWSAQTSSTGPSLIYLPLTSHQGASAARNAGWRLAQAPIIAFTEDDCVPEMRWLSTALATFTSDLSALSGRIVVPLPPQPTEYEFNTSQHTQRSFTTANCFYRRSSLEQLGGFDERFTSPWYGDTDLYFSLLTQHLPHSSTREAVVMHPPHFAPWGISLRQQKQHMFATLLHKKHSHLYHTHISKSQPWQYYAITLALLVAIIAALFQSWILTALALSLWLFMIGRFSWQRLHHTAHTPTHITEILITSALIPLLALFWRLRGSLIFHSRSSLYR